MDKKTKQPLDIKVSVRRYSSKMPNFAGNPGANSSEGRVSSYGNSGNSSS